MSLPPRTSDARLSGSPRVVAPALGPEWLSRVLTVLAGIYLASLFLESAAQRLPRAYLPPALLSFTQATCLFPRAARMAIEYRLEVWDCDAQRFHELDVSPLFPIRPDDKEGRFQRIGHFYRQNRGVLRALERYVIARQNTGREHLIGGVRLSSVRTPLPPLGAMVERSQPLRLDEYPSERIKQWYYTSLTRRSAFCAGKQPDPDRPADRVKTNARHSDPQDDDTQELPDDSH